MQKENKIMTPTKSILWTILSLMTIAFGLTTVVLFISLQFVPMLGTGVLFLISLLLMAVTQD